MQTSVDTNLATPAVAAIESAVLDEIINSGVVADGLEVPNGTLTLVGMNSTPVYPLFPFRENHPYMLHSVVADVCLLLEQDEDPLGAASWWFSPNSWLGNATPRELLGQGRDMDIIFAAEQLANDSW